jgi:hypothetical protein
LFTKTRMSHVREVEVPTTLESPLSMSSTPLDEDAPLQGRVEPEPHSQIHWTIRIDPIPYVPIFRVAETIR